MNHQQKSVLRHGGRLLTLAIDREQGRWRDNKSLYAIHRRDLVRDR